MDDSRTIILIIIAGIVVIARIIFRYTDKGSKIKPASNGNSESVNKGAFVAGGKSNTNKYKDMRGMAIAVTPEKLNVAFTDDKTYVYGTIIDWSYEDVVISIVGYATGDASIYFSSGAIFIGGVAHENIRKAAHDLVRASQHCLPMAQKITGDALPSLGHTRFNLLTNNGIYVYDCLTNDMFNTNSDWEVVFNVGQYIISLYRQLDEKNK